MDMKSLTKIDLPEPRQRLVALMQAINFGRIEDITVREGNPVFGPSPRVVREIKIGGENGPRPEYAAGNFLLKDQVVELFQHLDRLCNGTVQVLEVKHGLPFRLLVTCAE
jgi:hypothetical protein